MATINRLFVNGSQQPKSYGKRTESSGIFFHDDVKLGDDYWTLSFDLNESKKKNYIFAYVGLPMTMTYKEGLDYLQKIVSQITDKEIEDYDDFLQLGEDTRWE